MTQFIRVNVKPRTLYIVSQEGNCSSQVMHCLLRRQIVAKVEVCGFLGNEQECIVTLLAMLYLKTGRNLECNVTTELLMLVRH